MKNAHEEKIRQENEQARNGFPEYTPKLITDKELLELDCGNPVWYFDRMLPNPGLVAISGKPGSFKTFFAMWCARRIAAGLPLFNHFESQPSFLKENLDPHKGTTGVLFIEEEMSQVHMKKRALSLYSYPSEGIRMYWDIGNSFCLLNPQAVETLKNIVSEKGIRVIFMDPFSSISGLEDENSNAKAREVMDIIRKNFVDSALECTVIFIHHPSKGDTDSSTLRGAGDILGKCDMHFVLHKLKKGETKVKVETAKNRLATSDMEDFIMEMRETGPNKEMEWVYIGTAEQIEESMKSGKQNKMLDEINKMAFGGKEFSAEELAERMGLSRKGTQFRDAWKELVLAKKVIKKQKGRYGLN